MKVVVGTVNAIVLLTMRDLPRTATMYEPQSPTSPFSYNISARTPGHAMYDYRNTVPNAWSKSTQTLFVERDIVLVLNGPRESGSFRDTMCATPTAQRSTEQSISYDSCGVARNQSNSPHVCTGPRLEPSRTASTCRDTHAERTLNSCVQANALLRYFIRYSQHSMIMSSAEKLA